MIFANLANCLRSVRKNIPAYVPPHLITVELSPRMGAVFTLDKFIIICYFIICKLHINCASALSALNERENIGGVEVVTMGQVNVPCRFHGRGFLTRQRNNVYQKGRRSMPTEGCIVYDTALGRIQALFSAFSVIRGAGSITMTIRNGSCSLSGNFRVYSPEDQDLLQAKLREIDVIGFRLAHTMRGQFHATFSFNQRSFIVENGQELEVS